jgi:GNAT superfamily N-acetyltransferase
MTDQDLFAFAEDARGLFAIGPDEERIATDRFVVTFSPGDHFWSTAVARIRFEEGAVRDGLDEVRRLMAEHRRSAAAWTIGPSATPDDVVAQLVSLGLDSESETGSAILVLTAEPRPPRTPFEVRTVSTFEEHLAAIEVATVGFGFSEEDAADERRRAQQTFDAEREGKHVVRLLAFDRARPVATGEGRVSPFGIYLGGGATIPSHRRHGAMSALVGAAWTEAVIRGTPALVTFGGSMSTSPLERLGFRAIGRVRHLIDRLA